MQTNKPKHAPKYPPQTRSCDEVPSSEDAKKHRNQGRGVGRSSNFEEAGSDALRQSRRGKAIFSFPFHSDVVVCTTTLPSCQTQAFLQSLPQLPEACKNGKVVLFRSVLCKVGETACGCIWYEGSKSVSKTRFVDCYIYGEKVCELHGQSIRSCGRTPNRFKD